MNKVNAGTWSLYEGKVCRICGKPNCESCQPLAHMLVGKRVSYEGETFTVVGTTRGVLDNDLPRLLIRHRALGSKQFDSFPVLVEDVSFKEKSVFKL